MRPPGACAPCLVTLLRWVPGTEVGPLARKPNYDFEKRKKELDRKAKKDAKREERLRRRQDGGTDEPVNEEEEANVAQDDGTR